MSEEVKKKFQEFAKRMESDEDIFKVMNEIGAWKGLVIQQQIFSPNLK